MRSEQDRFREDTDEAITRLRTRVEELEKERGDLNCKLEDERRLVNTKLILEKTSFFNFCCLILHYLVTIWYRYCLFHWFIYFISLYIFILH